MLAVTSASLAPGRVQHDMPSTPAPGGMDIATWYFAEELRRSVGVEAAGEWLRGSFASRHCGSAGPASAASSVSTANSCTSSVDEEACEDSTCAECDASGPSPSTTLRRPRRNSGSGSTSSSPTRLQTSSDLAARRIPPDSPMRSAKPRCSRTPSAGRVSRMLRSGSQNAGLMFTDAAHCCEAELASFAREESFESFESFGG
jgi:hypothetical protein